MNERNLIPNSKRTPSELREITQKGGIASGNSRRKKRDMKQKMKTLLELTPAGNDLEQLQMLGIDPNDYDNETVLVATAFLRAAAGDPRWFDRVMQILGKDIDHEELALKKRELKLKEKEADRKCGTGKTSGDDPLTASLRELAKELDENGNK